MLSVRLLPISSFISSLPTLLFLLFFLPSLHLHFPFSLILSTMFLLPSFSSSSTIFICSSWFFAFFFDRFFLYLENSWSASYRCWLHSSKKLFSILSFFPHRDLMKMAEDGQKWENKEAVDGDFRQKLLVIKLLFALFLSFCVSARVHVCV